MRSYHLLLVFVLVSTWLSACGFTAGSPGQTVTKITFTAIDYDQDLYMPIIKRFNAANPDIQVQFVTPPILSGSPDQIMQGIVSAGDTASVDIVRPEDIRNGLLYNLTPLADADPQFDRADFYPGVLDLGSQSGQLYYLPQSVDVPLLAYNKALWEANHLPPPDPTWSWNDLMAAAEQLTHTTDGTIEVYGFSGSFDSDTTAFVAELAAHDLEPLTSSATEFQFAQPAVAAALERVKFLAETGVIYTSTGFSNQTELIAEQRIAIWERGMFTPSSSDWVAPFPIGVMPFPVMPLESSDTSPLNQSYIISAGTQHPEAAWRWIAYLSSQPLDLLYAFPESAPVPARRSVAEAQDYWSSLDAETRAAMTTAVERLDNFVPRAALDINIFGALMDATIAIKNDHQSVPAALAYAQTQLDQRVAEAARTPQPTPRPNPIAVATPIPSLVPAGATSITFNPGPLDTWELRTIAQEVNQAESGIFVEVMDAELAPLTASAQQSDCFATFFAPTPDDLPALADLQPLLDADARFPLADYPPALMAPFRQQGGLYGLPYATYLRVLVYNPTIFDTVGLDYPSAAWTMDDFTSAAHQLTSTLDKPKIYGFADPNPELNIPFFLNRANAQWTSEKDNEIDPNFNNPALVPPIRDYLTLLQATSPHTQLQGMTDEASSADLARDRFTAGEVAMLFDFGFTLALQEDSPAALAAPPLAGTRLTRNDVFPIGLFISAEAAHPEACWSWFQALNARRPAMPDTFPARISVAEAEEFRSAVPASAQAVYADYRPYLTTLPVAGSNYDPTQVAEMQYTWFFQAIDHTLAGAPLEQELDRAQRLTEQYLACVRAGGTRDACARQIEPDES